MLKYLFSKYLYIKSNDQADESYPTTNKIHLNRLQTYHEKYEVESEEEE